MTKKSLIFLWLILSLGIYLRLTKFINTFSLDTDQVQPFILAGKIINSRRILLLGYGPDRINFMTPLYHYLVTFIYFFFRNELIVTLIFSLLNISSIFVLFLFVKNILGTRSALLASLMFALSFEMIKYSRNIMDPHLVPFFFLAFFLLRTGKTVKFPAAKIILSGIFFLISLMYVSTYLVLPAYLYLLIRHLKLFRRNQKLITMAGLILLTVIFHTTVIQYHIKTNFRELASITSNSGSMNLLANPGKLIKSSTYNFFLINQGFISDGNNFSANILIGSLLIILSVFLFLKSKKRKIFFPFIFLPFISALLLSGVHIENYYLHRLSPLYIFYLIMFSALAVRILTYPGWKRKYTLLPLVFILIFVVISLNLSAIQNYIFKADFPFKKPHQIAAYIIKKVKNYSYSMYVSTPSEKTNYYVIEYLYALSKIKNKPVPVTTDDRGELHYNFNLQKEYLILICKDYPSDFKVNNDCFTLFTDEFSRKKNAFIKKFDTATVFIFENNEKV